MIVAFNTLVSILIAHADGYSKSGSPKKTSKRCTNAKTVDRVCFLCALFVSLATTSLLVGYVWMRDGTVASVSDSSACRPVALTFG